MKNLLTIVVIIFPAFYFGVNGTPLEMGIILTASSISLFFLNIDKFKSIRTSFFEARINELEQNVRIIKFKVDTFFNNLSQLNKDASSISPIVPVFNKKAKPLELINDIDKYINCLKNINTDIYNAAIDKEKSLIEILDKNNIDLNDFTKDESLSNILFETYNIRSNNTFVYLDIFVKQLKIIIITSELKKDPDNGLLIQELRKLNENITESITSSSLID